MVEDYTQTTDRISKTMVFYSQSEQDRFIFENLYKDFREGIFVEIGAHDGIHISNTYFFEKEMGWTGLCIEPRASAFQKLVENRQVACLNCCIGLKEEKVLFLNAGLLSGILREYDKQHIERIENYFRDKPSQQLSLQWSDVRTLSSLCDEHGIKKVNLLSIDTEGGELEILKTIDFQKTPVETILCEDNYGNFEELRNYLRNQEYVLCKRLGNDGIFIQKDLMEKILNNENNNRILDDQIERLSYQLGNFIWLKNTDINFLQGHWSVPNNWGIWVDGEKASIHLKLDSLPHDNLVLLLAIRQVFSISNEKLSVKFFSNKNLLITSEFCCTLHPIYQTISIPSEFVNENLNLDILIEVSRYISDNDDWIKVSDRDISLYLEGLQIFKESDAMYELGQTLYFNKSGVEKSVKSLGKGWSVFGNKGLWSTGKESILLLKLAKAANYPVKLEININHLFVADNYENFKLTIMVNNSPLATYSKIADFDCSSPLVFTLKEEVLNKSKDRIEIVFLMDANPVSDEVPHSNTTRQFGIELASVKAEATKVDTPQQKAKSPYYVRSAPRFIDLMNMWIEKDDPVVFDVGANTGQSIKLFRSIFKDPKLFCFEPDQDCLKVLSDTYGSDNRISIVPTALGSTQGTLQFHRTSATGTNSFLKVNLESEWRKATGVTNTEPVVVPIQTLDHYCQVEGISHIDVLKMDVQGFEPEVLAGACEFLSNHKVDFILTKIIFHDFYTQRLSFYALEEHLIPMGYRLFTIFTPVYSLSGEIWQCDALYLHDDAIS
ncbi:MAG: FkbM family methyltransferase [Okeania sp. SIO3H1]|nr:FkbM family methyltransferase [Okeania sp. SIO3H1]